MRFSSRVPALLLLAFSPSLTAQALEPPEAPVAALAVALYNEQANVREPDDTLRAALATEVLRTRLAERLGSQFVSPAAVDSLAGGPEALALSSTSGCNVRIACATMVAGRLGAGWVILAKVSKTSNLIWLLSAQLIQVSTGEVILGDTTELKGDPDAMVRAGMRIFADRVVRTVRNGGVANDFPAP